MRCGLIFAAILSAVNANNPPYDWNRLYPPTRRPDPPKYEPENPPHQPDYQPQPRPDPHPDLDEIETYEEPSEYPEPSKPVPPVPSAPPMPVAPPSITVTNMNNVRTNMFCSSIDRSVIAANPTLRYMCNQQNSAFIGGATQLDNRMPRNSAGAAALSTALGMSLAAGLAGNAVAGNPGAGLNQGITVTNMNNVATNMFCSRISAAELTVNPMLAIMCNQVGSAAISDARQERSSLYPQYPVEPVYPAQPAYPEVYPAPALYPVPAPVASPPISVTNMNNVATNMFCSSISSEQMTLNPALAVMCNQAFSAAISGAAQVEDRAPRNTEPYYPYYPAPVPAVQPVPAVSPPITVTNLNNVYTNMFCSSLSVEQLTVNPELASMCNQLGSAAISGAGQRMGNSEPLHPHYPAPVPAASPPITVTNMNNVYTNMFCSTLSVEQLTVNPALASMCNQVGSAAISDAIQGN